jgi:hypothetical protein
MKRGIALLGQRHLAVEIDLVLVRHAGRRDIVRHAAVAELIIETEAQLLQ